MENVKITSFEIENVKRIKAVAIDCEGQALTVIGGRNGQGKTSILDTIMWTLGGDAYKPSSPIREGEEKMHSKVTLSNGVIAERNGKNGTLKVTSSNGKGGQALLNDFICTFALDLPKFMNSSGKEKGKILLEQFPGLGSKLQQLVQDEKRMYEERVTLGRIGDQKDKYSKELPFIPDLPEVPMSGNEMATKLKDALSENARNDEIRRNPVKIEEDIKRANAKAQAAEIRIKALQEQLNTENLTLRDAKANSETLTVQLKFAKDSAATLKDTDTTAIEKEMEDIDLLNSKIRANQEKVKAEHEATEIREQYNELTKKIEEVRESKIRLLSSVKMPLAELSINDAGELVYKGQEWDCMSSSEQLKVATAICSVMKPSCGFVLIDKLECMDVKTLKEFAQWLKDRNMHAIGTRVGDGSENSVVIEDGVVSESNGSEEDSSDFDLKL